jgi:site-specific DNA recombinase
MSIVGKMGLKTRIVCTKARESRTCANLRPYDLTAIEALVLEGLRAKLSDRRAIYNDEHHKLSSGRGAERAKMEGRITVVAREFERAAELAIKGILSDDETGERLSALRAERAELERRLAEVPEVPKVVVLQPAILSRYLRQLKRIEQLVGGAPEDVAEIRDAIRDVITTVVVHPVGPGMPPEIEVTGLLSKFIEADTTSHNRWGSMVAGEGLEPPTPGL